MNKKILLSEKKTHDNGFIIESLLHDSSNLLKTSYNFNTKRLRVTFIRGKVYEYFDIPQDIYEQFKISESTGSFLSKEIVKKYNFLEIAQADKLTLSNILTEIASLKESRKSE